MDTKLKIKSDALGYDFNVTIKEMGESEKKPIFYITDGESFLDNNLALLLDSLTSAKVIPPAYYAFVGSIDERSGENVRNNLFFCNETYLSFFEQELIPEVEAEIGKTFNPQGRGLIGISFGGLNAAYFAAKGNAFQNIAILSPITYPCSELNQSIAFSERKVLNLFLSSGKNDAESYLAEIHHMFKTKNYNTRVLNTDGSHDFENWKQQLREVIQFLTQP
ncbi:MAG: alpha/beta hydrolase-fold protein [Chlamydiota bacterium]